MLPRAAARAAARRLLSATPVRQAAAPASPPRLAHKVAPFRPAAFSTSSSWKKQPSSGSPEGSPAKPNDAPKDDQKPKPKPDDDGQPEAIPLSALPDLTQGIPSTLEYETAGGAAARGQDALAPFRDDGAGYGGSGGGGGGGGGGGRGKGELPASAYVSSSERRRQKVANYLFFGSLGLGVAATVYAGRDWDDEAEAQKHAQDAPNGWGLGLWWARARARAGGVLSYYQEPAFEKLLPDPDPVYGRPYTLCISLEDMLIHSEWTREHGWRIAKRPGVDYFLHYLSQYYEIVLFTTIPFGIGEPIVRKLDPYRFIVYPLFREATKYQNGEIVKDLSYLNRDLSKVIMIDTDASHVRAQPENAILLPPWQGDAKDTALVGLIPFLEYIYTMQYGDVRTVLKSFEGTDIPTEFARREAIARAEFQKQLASQRGRRAHAGGGGGGGGGSIGIGGLGALLGLKSSNMSVLQPVDGEPNTAEQLAQGKMLQDIARERGQRNYELLEKEIRENGEKWLKEEAAMQEKMQQEAMQNMKQSFAGWFLGSQGQKEAEVKKEERP